MKLTLKQSSIAMAICASLYMALLVAYQIPGAASFLYQCQLLPYLPQALLLVGIIVMGLTLYFNAHQLPTLTKSLKRQAVCWGVITLCIILYNLIPVNSIHINGFRYCYWRSSWMHIAMVAWLTAWLWQYAFMKQADTFCCKPMKVTSALIVFVAALFLVLMVTSGIHVMIYDHVAGFKTRGWLSWLRPLMAIGFFGTYLYGERVYNKVSSSKTANSNDTPTQAPSVIQFSKANNILAWASICTLTIFSLLAIIGACFSWFRFGYFEDKFLICLLSSIHLLWICSVVSMLLEKSVQRWLRIMNIIAPLIINGAIVLAMIIVGFMPDYLMRDFEYTNIYDLLMVVFFLSIAFPIVVWLINTFVVLRSKTINRPIIK